MPLIDVPAPRDDRYRMTITPIVPDPATHLTNDGKPLPAPWYWACQWPERKPTQHCTWSNTCHACLVHSLACVYTGTANPRMTVGARVEVGAAQRITTYGEALLGALVEVGDEWLATRTRDLLAPPVEEPVAG